MTARSSVPLAMLALVFAFACGRSEPPTDNERAERQLASDIADLSSADLEQRARAATGVAVQCCGGCCIASEHTRSRACQALTQLLATERDPRVLVNALHHDSPFCHARVPARVFVDIALTRPPDDVRSILSHWLADIEPSAEAMRDIIASLDLASGVDVPGYMLAALGTYGEDDLAPVVEMLVHPERPARKFAVQTITAAALEGPLDLPNARERLERIRELREDQDLAERAESSLYFYQRHVDMKPDEIVERYLADDVISQREMRMLGVRRFSCKTDRARVVLEHLANEVNASANEEARRAAEAAKFALAIRTKRCARLGR